MTEFRNVTFDEIEVGSTVSVSRPVTQTEVETMALVSGDVDPWHLAPDVIERQGPLTAQAVGAEAVLSMVLNRRLPGPGTRIIAQDLAFEGAIAVGPEVTARVTAREKRAEGAIVIFDCTVSQDGVALVSGTVTVKAPTRHIAYDEVITPELVLRHTDVFAKLLRRCQGFPPCRARWCIHAIATPCSARSRPRSAG